MPRRKINRCIQCENPLKHLDNNKWMCDQSPTVCVLSTQVKFLNNPDIKDDEEEWMVTSDPLCPVCNSTLFERHAGLYCYNWKCPQFSQKVVSCCEGGCI